MEMKQQIRAMEGELTNVVKEQAEFTVQMNDAKVLETGVTILTYFEPALNIRAI
jgi:hypothetical protein